MLCVIAKLSGKAAEKLRDVREAALPPEAKNRPLYGHITLATYLPEDCEAFIRACGEMVRGCPSFCVRYEKIAVLSETSIIAALPRKGGFLAYLHGRIAEKYGVELDRWTRDDSWIPHTTLLYDPEADQEALCRVMQERFEPFEAKVERIELSGVEKDGYRILKSFDLL